MATTAHQIVRDAPTARNGVGAAPFAASFAAFCVLAAAMITQWPIQLSIATVFLFAGPHNWVEFRYFLARMPLRWGRAKTFYSVGLGGVAVLSLSYIALYLSGGSWYLTNTAWTLSTAIWNSSLVLWICVLVHIRRHNFLSVKTGTPVNPASVFGIGCAACCAIWLFPFWFSVALVYLHPLVALWFLDREIKRRRPHWRSAYHQCLGILAALVVLIWIRLASAPNLPDDASLSWRITQHAGAGFITGVSSHLLVTTHVFLETVHYSVWLVLIPMAGLGAPLLKTTRIPLASPNGGWPRPVASALIAGGFVVLALWVAFGMHYVATRDLYFTFAIAHVLAEMPFLIRLL